MWVIFSESGILVVGWVYGGVLRKLASYRQPVERLQKFLNCMSSWFYYNYPKTAAKLTKFFFVILIVSLTVGFFINNKSAPVDPSKFSTLRGTLKSKPEPCSGSDNKECLILLNEFPHQKFRFGKYASHLSATNQFLASAAASDSVFIEVYDFLANRTNSTYDIFGLKNTTVEYFTSTNFLEEQKESESLFWLFLVAAIVLLTVYALLEFTGKIDQFAKWFDKGQTSLADYRKVPQPRDFNEIDVH